MPLNDSPRGTARVSIVAMPKYFGNRLVYLSWKGEYSWAVRDFITGVILRSGDSLLKLSDLEALVTYSERPVYRSVGREAEWTAELIESSKRFFGAKYDDRTRPTNDVGRWKRLSGVVA
jgi:hypothetical protein